MRVIQSLQGMYCCIVLTLKHSDDDDDDDRTGERQKSGGQFGVLMLVTYVMCADLSRMQPDAADNRQDEHCDKLIVHDEWRTEN